LSTPAHKAGPIEANIAEEFDINDDYSVFYFKLRKGLKWSDGVPVSTEDVRFTYEEVIKNKEITPTPHYRFRSGCKPDGKLAELEIIDDLAFRITYEKGCGTPNLTRTKMLHQSATAFFISDAESKIINDF
jgi:peptide/nickel transport system substrate-binding protein